MIQYIKRKKKGFPSKPEQIKNMKIKCQKANEKQNKTKLNYLGKKKCLEMYIRKQCIFIFEAH